MSITPIRQASPKSRLEFIEDQVRELQLQLWNERRELTWPGNIPNDPLAVLEPAVALHLLGYSTKSVHFLGEISQDGRKTEAAGSIDFESKTVNISSMFSRQIQLYTVAHELGHAVLHPGVGGKLRDRPLEGPTDRRLPMEREADQFAARFLMPKRQVTKCFEQRFGQGRFSLNDETAFALASGGVEKVERRYRTPRDLSRGLAQVQQYDGRQFLSLATQFSVTPTAMAIRLEELNLL